MFLTSRSKSQTGSDVDRMTKARILASFQTSRGALRISFRETDIERCHRASASAPMGARLFQHTAKDSAVVVRIKASHLKTRHFISAAA